MTKEQRLEWTQHWRKVWNSIREMAFVLDDIDAYSSAQKELITSAHKLFQLPPPDRQAANEAQLRIKLDCNSGVEELPKA